MKLIKSALPLIVLLFAAFQVKAEGNKMASRDTIQIHTSAVCGMCKVTIETALAYEKGVISSDLDVESKVVTVVYKPKKTNPDKIKKAISMVGYSADEMDAEPKAFQKLHGCCKPGAHG